MLSSFRVPGKLVQHYIGSSVIFLESLYDALPSILPFLKTLDELASTDLKIITPNNLYVVKNDSFNYRPQILSGMNDGTLSFSMTLDDKDGQQPVGWSIDSGTGSITKNLDGSDIGQTRIHITATDSGSSATSTITVNTIHMLDYTQPLLEITMVGESVVQLTKGTEYNDLGFTTNLTPDNKSTINNVDTSMLGVHLVTYIATKDGLTRTVIRVINVVSEAVVLPTITLNGDNPVILAKGDVYTDAGAEFDNTTNSNIVGADDINTDHNGVFFVEYTAVGDTPNLITKATRTVAIIDCSGSVTLAPEYSYILSGDSYDSQTSYVAVEY